MKAKGILNSCARKPPISGPAKFPKALLFSSGKYSVSKVGTKYALARKTDWIVLKTIRSSAFKASKTKYINAPTKHEKNMISFLFPILSEKAPQIKLMKTSIKAGNAFIMPT